MSSSSVQLHVAISKTSAKVVLDCAVVGEKAISAAGNITIDGVEILGRMVRSRGRRDNSAPVSMDSHRFNDCIVYKMTRTQRAIAVKLCTHIPTGPKSPQICLMVALTG